MAASLSFGSTMRSGHILDGWRCRLNLSMFLLTISVGRFWSVQSVLEFNVIKKKLEDHVRHREGDSDRSISYGFSRVIFFTPSDSSLVRNWFVCSEPRTPVVKLV